MAIAKVADRTTVNGNAAVTTVDLVLSGLTVGNHLIIRTAADNSGTNGAVRSITVANQSGTPVDTATDVAFQQNTDPGAASAGVTCNVVIAKITATSGTVRITYSGSVVQAAVAEEWAGIHASTFVVGSPVGASGTASTNLASCADASIAAGNVAYGAMAIEGPAGDTITEDADTTNGSWVSLTKAGTTNATADTNMTVTGGYKIVTAAGAQTYNPTINNARDSAGIIVELAQAIRTGTSAQTLPSFSQSAAGTVADPVRTGTAAQTLPAFVQAATGTVVEPTRTGTAAQTLAAVTQSATGTVDDPVYTGTAAQSLAAFTQAATGTHVDPTVTGTSTQSLPALAQTASGSHTAPVYEGTAGNVLAAFTQSAAGTVSTPIYTGTANQALPAVGQSATGEIFAPTYSGELVQILPLFTQSAAGTFVSTGGLTGAQVLPRFEQHADGMFELGVFEPTPAERTRVIAAEHRSHRVNSDCRAAAIPSESRELQVRSESRVLTV